MMTVKCVEVRVPPRLRVSPQQSPGEPLHPCHPSPPFLDGCLLQEGENKMCVSDNYTVCLPISFSGSTWAKIVSLSTPLPPSEDHPCVTFFLFQGLKPHSCHLKAEKVSPCITEPILWRESSPDLHLNKTLPDYPSNKLGVCSFMIYPHFVTVYMLADLFAS